MAERLPIAVASLLVDLKNWRLPQPQSGQREAQREIARRQGDKLLKLAEDIAKYGPNLADLPIVMPSGTRYIVLEGNRRLVALRACFADDTSTPGCRGVGFVGGGTAVGSGCQKSSGVYSSSRSSARPLVRAGPR